jgi:GntR family transcriptional regulator
MGEHMGTKDTMMNKDESTNADNKMDYRMPIYLQLRELVRNKIDEGEYLPGTAIPSENKLAETFGINRLTVRNAVEALVNEGILQRVQGKGVFVVGDKYEEALEEHGGFVTSPSLRNKRVSMKELDKTLRYAGDKYSNFFDIAQDDLIFDIRHLNYIDDTPLSLEQIFVPEEILPQLKEVNSSVFSMMDIFTFYGIEVCSMRQNMELVTKGLSKIRKILGVPDDVALIMMECSYRDQDGRMIEFSRSFIRSDKCSFRISLHE